MPATLAYPDAYLAKFCTEERETRVLADVDAAGTFVTAWRGKPTVNRCYIIVCLEIQPVPDDLFPAKQRTPLSLLN